MAEPYWQPAPEAKAPANLAQFMDLVRERWSAPIRDYWDLDRWAVEQPQAFWSAVWDFGGVVASTRGENVLEDGERMPGARWFPEARLNFAENLLRRRDEATAIVFWGEDKVRRRLSYQELYAAVSRLASALKARGVGIGDCVAGYLPNLPDAVIAMLASTSLGATWSSCSPDFGAAGVLDRFGQIEPKILLTADGYYYGGKEYDSLARVREIQRELPSLRQVVVVPYARQRPDISRLADAELIDDFIAPFPAGEIEFVQLPFAHPLYILFSSGTTGAPKALIHSAGGTLLQHLKELLLHVDLQPHDRLFYFTTCGWMMWNWLVSGLAAGASLLLYDGSPFYPDPHVLFDYADAEAMTVFGTSAKYIQALAKAGSSPIKTHRLRELRTILSTGSPLAPEDFDYVRDNIKRGVQLSSISGGTDIVSCFVLGSPLLPVWRGEIQCRGLGMAVAVYDEAGREVRGQKGELVCTRPFPSMPLGLVNDPRGEKYRETYFDYYPNVWRHGDYAELTEHNGFIIYGRSDATLKPGGVRIGTAEIYRPVEQLPEVMESVAVGQEWDNNVRIVLFVRLQAGLVLDQALVERIKGQIRAMATPRHLPAKVLQVQDIPRTKNNKIAELAVREAIHGRPVKNVEALANPEALREFRGRPELQE